MRSRNPLPGLHPAKHAHTLSQPAAAPIPLVYPLHCGPLRDNGATPWYAAVALGNPGQTLNIAFDTGSNFIWSMSSLCGQGPCQRGAAETFAPAGSASWSWLDRSDRMVNFGPWGNMIVQLGADDLGLTSDCAVRSPFFVTKYCDGGQFAELDWSGGIGLPSASAFADPEIPLIVERLMALGLVDPEYPYIAFDLNPLDKSGTCRIGPVDPAAFVAESAVFMRWSPYQALPGVPYLWTTALDRYVVGQEEVAANAVFCLDSGSSVFKGDENIMNNTLRLVQASKPDLKLSLGTTRAGTQGELTIPADVYMANTETRDQGWKDLPQFTPMALPELVLVGSTVMDHVYTVFEYDVTQTAQGYSLAAVGMWMFNKPGGRALITSGSHDGGPILGRKPVHPL